MFGQRFVLTIGATALLANFAVGCADKECKCDCTGAAATGEVADKETATASSSDRYAGEVRTGRDGSRVVTLSDGTVIHVAEDGEVRVTEKDRGTLVVDRRGEIREANRDWQVVVVDGTRKVYSSSTNSMVTEKEYEAVRINDEPPKKLETAPKALTAADPEPEPTDDAGDGKGKVLICHVPPGNPANEHTLSIGASAVDAHLGHGDYLGECDGRNASAGKGNGKDKDKGKGRGGDDEGEDDDRDGKRGEDSDHGKDRHDDTSGDSKPTGGILQTHGDDDAGKTNRSRGKGRGRSRK